MTNITINEVENAYQELIQYETEVKEFLINVMGYHASPDWGKWQRESKKRLYTLKEKDAFTILTYLHMYEKQNNDNKRSLSSIENERLKEISVNSLMKIRNIKCWLNAIDYYLSEMTS